MAENSNSRRSESSRRRRTGCCCCCFCIKPSLGFLCWRAGDDDLNSTLAGDLLSGSTSDHSGSAAAAVSAFRRVAVLLESWFLFAAVSILVLSRVYQPLPSRSDLPINNQVHRRQGFQRFRRPRTIIQRANGRRHVVIQPASARAVNH